MYSLHEKVIHLGRTLEAFLTTITLGLGALFPPRIAFLVRGHKLRQGDRVGGLCALTVLDKGCKTLCLRIKTLGNQHGLVRLWRFVGEEVDQFRLF